MTDTDRYDPQPAPVALVTGGGGGVAGTWSRVTPLRRIGTPADIGRAVVMLDGPGAAFITGQTILVDGGLFTSPPWPSD